MTNSWHTILTGWYRHQRRRRTHKALGSSIIIELDAPSCRNPKRANSGVSCSSVTFVDNDHIDSKPKVKSQPEETINVMLDFGVEVHSKPLDYGTFSRWGAIKGLIIDLEKDGLIIEEIWDAVEKMRVCSGDWEARVRPGWDLLVHCQDVQACPEKDRSDDDSDSEDTESEEESWAADVIDQYQEEWCLPRWRDRVEQEKSTGGNMEEPSWVVLSLGCLSVVFFIVAVIVYTA